MQTVAYNAIYRDLEGIAARFTDGTVHFRNEATQVWTQLFNSDIADLHLMGRVDIAAAQALADGDLLQLVDARNSHRPLAA
jgi:hypothetical protein